MGGRGQFPQTAPGQAAIAIRSQGQGWGEVHCYLKAWAKASGKLWGGPWSPAGHSPKPVLWTTPAHPPAKAREQAGGPWVEGRTTSYLILHLPTCTPLTLG